MKRWKGAITKCLVFLLLGAVVNVTVAWGCVRWSHPEANWMCICVEKSRYSGLEPVISREDGKRRKLVISDELVGDRRRLVRMGWPPPPEIDHTHFPLVRYTSRGFGVRWHSLDELTSWDHPVAPGYVRRMDRRRHVSKQITAGWPATALFGECWLPVASSELYASFHWRESRQSWCYQRESVRYPNRNPIGTYRRARRDDWFYPLRPVFPGFALNTVFYAVLLWLLIRGPFALRRIIRRKRGRCLKCGYDLRGDLGAGCPECGWGRLERDA